MSSILHRLLLGTFLVILPQLASARRPETVTIREPGIIKLADLFKMADSVVLVRVVSGDTENYATAVYKAEVLQSFKGVEKGETIYFGPYDGTRLGWEYVLFLRRAAELLVPKAPENANYGTVHYLKVFNEGYSSMETSYECVFDGKNVADQCDYGVKVCTDYIVLPKSLSTFPPMAQSTPFGCRSVRKKGFISVLGSLHESIK